MGSNLAIMTSATSLLALTMSSLATPPDAIEFNRDILPILSNNCFTCHGPDPNTRQADLRLDSLETATAVRPEGAVIVPGDTGASLLLHRINTDTADRMPPPDSNLELTADEIQLLTRWIEAGANWESHWAFTTPEAIDLPTVGDVQWPRNGIDAFILARLELNGLKPNPPADRRTLIRRVSLDLIGLPPTHEEIQAFLVDDEAGAYERVVDRLLASPRYGEHMARPWLDLARYADSQGFEKDNPRTMWRYRDWVIDALNADMPFDTFTREQLAGDLLDSPTQPQLIATGFHRNTQTNTEGGTDNEEFRSAAVIDRVNTTMQGWMGLTVGCAQCHAHKYDPLSHEEYYGLYAFFNQTEDADLDDDAPFIPAPTPTQQIELDQLQVTLDALNARLAPPDPEIESAVDTWLSTRSASTSWTSMTAAAMHSASGATLSTDDEGIIHVTGDVPLTDTYELEFTCDLDRITALRLEVIEGPDGHGPGRTTHGNFVLNEFELRLNTADATLVDFHTAEATHEQTDFPATSAIDGDASAPSGWAIAPIYDQTQTVVFQLREPLALDAADSMLVSIRQTYGTQHVLERFRLSATGAEQPSLPTTPAIAAILDTTREERTDQQRETLARHVLPRSPLLAPLHTELEQVQAQHIALMKDVPNALICRELAPDMQRQTHLFLGGSFLAPDTAGGPIDPMIPSVLHDFPEDAPRNRLGLSQWLTHPENPLTARVQVNRMWAELFGTGIVRTVDDFGIQGARPSHPELLDWLAITWSEELGWSPKALARLLVTSATYRQAAVVDEDMQRLDPDNILLARAPRLRLSAEQLRDQALAHSGLLVTDRIGGPSVLPHLPDGMLPQAFTSLVLQASTGDDLYRRGLYTTWRRTGHYPSFATFDAPSRELCTITRERSNTPLQALVLLNDAVFVEAAAAMARLLIEREHDDMTARIDTLFEEALARPPTDRERTIMLDLYAAAMDEASRNPEQAHVLATTHRGPLPETMAAEDAAAMTAVCNVVFNLDEYVNRP